LPFRYSRESWMEASVLWLSNLGEETEVPFIKSVLVRATRTTNSREFPIPACEHLASLSVPRPGIEPGPAP
jgi:hypothetical protein